MSIYFPNNIFTRVLASCLLETEKIKFSASAQIIHNILADKSSVGLIPVMDLLRHKDLFVSAKYGISFEESLCNSYIYYNSKEKEINKISLTGDVSSQEVVLSKILFKEMYGSEVEIEILTNAEKAEDKNVIIIGDDNFSGERYKKGISFSEVMIDTLSLPFVNYVFASTEKETLELFEKQLEGIQTKFYNMAEDGTYLSEDREEILSRHFKENISSVVLKLDIQDREGIEQILRLPYFHGIVKDIVEVKFV